MYLWFDQKPLGKIDQNGTFIHNNGDGMNGFFKLTNGQVVYFEGSDYEMDTMGLHFNKGDCEVYEPSARPGISLYHDQNYIGQVRNIGECFELEEFDNPEKQASVELTDGRKVKFSDYKDISLGCSIVRVNGGEMVIISYDIYEDWREPELEDAEYMREWTEINWWGEDDE